MPARKWWWQRIHPALRVVFAAVYFGGAIAILVFAITPGHEDRPPSETALPNDEVATTTTSIEEQPPATGPELFQAHCASCHGQNLEGDIGPDLGRGSEAISLSDNRILSRMENGRREMPSFSDTLSEAEMQLILDYIREQQAS